MNFTFTKTPRAALLALALMAAGIVPAGAQPLGQAPVLLGHWASVAPENMGQMHTTRSFNFEGDRWRVQLRAFADADAKQPLFTLDVGGVFVLGGPSAKVSGAWEGVFPAQYRRITAESDAGAAMFAGMGCVLKPGQAVALTNQGCGFVPALMQAMGEYDLVALKGGQLFLGDRAGDLTKLRPEALTRFPLTQR